ncbi:MAG: TetR/AcrR family transcriptional regulator [Eubacterium sp.]|nr:TetR/AcrR family transcriptional regulator [Eubacterium sp.]
MATENKKGITTRKKILDTCRDLFYERGFMALTFSEICKQTDTNPGSVSYHFKSKINIALLIYSEIMEKLADLARVYCPEEDHLRQRMFALGLHLKLFYSNANYRRFSAEVCTQRAYDTKLDHFVYSHSEPFLLSKQYMEEKQAKLYFAAFVGMDGYLESYIADHIDDFTFEDILTSYLELHYSFLDHTALHQNIEATQKKLDDFPIAIGPAFLIDLSEG